jgi:hypothetical protein
MTGLKTKTRDSVLILVFLKSVTLVTGLLYATTRALTSLTQTREKCDRTVGAVRVSSKGATRQVERKGTPETNIPTGTNKATPQPCRSLTKVAP